MTLIQQENAARNQERQYINKDDELRSPDLTADRAIAFVEAVKNCRMVKKAWLAERVL